MPVTRQQYSSALHAAALLQIATSPKAVSRTKVDARRGTTRLPHISKRKRIHAELQRSNNNNNVFRAVTNQHYCGNGVKKRKKSSLKLSQHIDKRLRSSTGKSQDYGRMAITKVMQNNRLKPSLTTRTKRNNLAKVHRVLCSCEHHNGQLEAPCDCGFSHDVASLVYGAKVRTIASNQDKKRNPLLTTETTNCFFNPPRCPQSKTISPGFPNVNSKHHHLQWSNKLSPGIFLVTSKLTRKMYVGSSWDISAAKQITYASFAAGSHPNKALQREFSSCVDCTSVEDYFRFEIVERILPDIFGRKSAILETSEAEKLLENRRQFHEQTAQNISLVRLVKICYAYHARPVYSHWLTVTKKVISHELKLAATKVQAFWRGSRYRMIVRRKTCHAAALLLQRVFRGFLLHIRALNRSKQRQQATAATIIQCMCRSFVAREQKDMQLQKRERDDAAWVIQNVFRCFVACRLARDAIRHKRRMNAATKIQSWAQCRLRVVRKFHYQRRLRAAITIQRVWRGRCGRMHAARIKQQNVQQNQAAISLQCAFRVRRAKQERAMRGDYSRAATLLQSTWRGKCGRAEVMQRKDEKVVRDNAATTVQVLWRSKKQQWDTKQSAAARNVQSLWRGKRARKEAATLALKRQEQRERVIRERQLAELQKNAAILVQRQVRRVLAVRVVGIERRRKQLEAAAKEEKLKHESSVRLQSWWRGILGRRIALPLSSARATMRRDAAVRIQCMVRGHLVRLHSPLTFEICEECGEDGRCVRLYCYDCRLRLCQFCSDCIHGLGAFKGHSVCNVNWSKRHMRNATVIQRIVRGTQARAQAKRIRHRREEDAKKLIQLQLRQAEEETRLRALEVATLKFKRATQLQSWWCACAGRKRIVLLKQLRDVNNTRDVCARKVQNCIRRYLSRRDTEKREQAALRVQTRYRAHRGVLATQLRRQALRDETKAATLLQGIVRGNFARKELARRTAEQRKVTQQKEFIRQRELEEARREHAALKVQTRWRVKNGQFAVQLIRNAKKELDVAEKADPFAEFQWIRTWDPRKKSHYYFNKVTHEIEWNKPVMYDVERRRYEALKHKRAATKLQSLFRGNKDRKDAKAEKKRIESAAIRIQTQWRARKARTDLSTRLRRQAERKLRAREEAELQHKQTRAAMMVQNVWRGRQAKLRVGLLRAQDRAARRVQRVWRGRQGRFAAMLLRNARAEADRSNWEEYYDDDYQSTYYYNIITEQVVWTLPESLQKHEEEHETKHVQIQGWEVLHDDQDGNDGVGRMYFYNIETGHTTWRCPAELQGLVERSAKDQWQETRDTETGHKAYFDIDTGELSWKRPDGLGPDPDYKPGDEWLASVHLVTGLPYYTNLETGEVKWERPDVLGKEWEELVRDGNGEHSAVVTYWRNKVTHEETLEKPAEYWTEMEIEQHQVTQTSSTWHEKVDESSGSPYYVLWDPVEEAVVKAVWEKPVELMTEQEIKEQECKNWEEYWSKEEKAVYYVNVETGESVWRQPDCFR